VALAERFKEMLTIVVVCYQSAGEFLGCLETVFKEKAAQDFRVVAVNNSQVDSAEIAAICDRFGVTMIQNAENVGYGRGCNIGARRMRDSRYTLFLNPDVRFAPQSLRRMVEIADAHPDIVALGPLQSGRDGRVRGKRRSVGQGPTFGAPLRDGDCSGAVVDTGFISGGALMVRTDVFLRIGGFDERIFLFHEDDDLCLRLARHGRLAYATDIVVDHRYGSSTPRTDELTRVRSWHLGFSRVYVIRKHHGRRAALISLLHAVLKFLSPEMISARGRIKARAFFDGTRTALWKTDLSASAVSI
jgi:GT2 family glycosyltransferase